MHADTRRWVQSRHQGWDLDRQLERAKQGRYEPRELFLDWMVACCLDHDRMFEPGLSPVPTQQFVSQIQKAKGAGNLKIKGEEDRKALLAGEAPPHWTWGSSVTDTPTPVAPVGEVLQGTIGDGGSPSPGVPVSDPELQRIIERQRVIGATDAVAILGGSPWKGAYEIQLEKTLPPEQLREIERAKQDTDVLASGRYLEAAVARWYADLHPDVRLDGDGQTLYRHETIEWAAASPDRIAYVAGADPYLVEIKTSSDWPWAAPPAGYVDQVHWQHLVLSSRMALSCQAVIVALFRGRSYREYPITIDPMRCQEMLVQVDAWREEHIVHGVVPDISTSRRPAESIALHHPESTEGHLDLATLGGDVRAKAAKLAADLVLWGQRLDQAERIRDIIRGRLGEIIGSHKGLLTPTHTISWHQVSGSRRTDWESVARKRGATQEDIDAATTQAATRRQWRITERKEK
jgi:predicted phage-related endonuclease